MPALKMRTGYWINSTDQTVTRVEFRDGSELRKLVGGWIEVAFIWPSRDVLYVDENGLLKNPKYFFGIPERPDQTLAGNGVLVGRELGNTDRTAPPTMTLDELQQRVTFLQG